MGLGEISRSCRGSDFYEGPDDQTSQEPTLNDMVDLCRMLAWIKRAMAVTVVKGRQK
jgi:hypothetical protein